MSKTLYYAITWENMYLIYADDEKSVKKYLEDRKNTKINIRDVSNQEVYLSNIIELLDIETITI